MRLEVDTLVAGYGKVEVLHGISLTVGQGERVGLFGPNGHGKTTLLRAISGLIRARSGSVTFGQDSAYGLDSYGSGDAGAAFQ